MGQKIFVDSHFVDKEYANVTVCNYGLLYGNSIYNGLRCYNLRALFGENDFTSACLNLHRADWTTSIISTS